MPFGEPHSHTPQLVVIPEIPDDLLPVDGENVVASGDFLSSLAVTMTPTVSFINGKFQVTLQPKVVAEEVRGDTFGSDSLGVHNLSEQEEATFKFDSSLVEAGRTPLESLVSESSIVAPLYSTTLHPDINFGPGGIVVESTPPSPPIEISEEETLISEGTVMPSILNSTTEKQPSVKPVLPIRSTDIHLDHDDTTKSSLSSSVHSTGSVTEDKVKDTSVTTQVMGMTTQKDDSIKTTTHTVVSGLGPTSAHMDHLDTDESGLSVQTTKEFNLTLPTQGHSTTTTRKKDIPFTFTPSSSETVKMQKEATSEFMTPSTKNLEMTTAKHKLSPSHFSSVLPSSEASGDETLFRTTTISSALYTITISDQGQSKTTKTISVSGSTDAEITRDQTTERHSKEPVSTLDSTETSTERTFISLSTGALVLTESTEIISGSSSADVEATGEQTTEAHSREHVSSLDSTVTSTERTFTSLSTGDSTGRTDASQDISHIATTTDTPMEDKYLSAKPPESTIINVTDTLFSSAQTGHLDEKLSQSTVTSTMITEKTTAKDVLSPSHFTVKDELSLSSFASVMPSTESEASGDEISDIFSKEFTTSSSLYSTTKSDKELSKTTETISGSSSTDADITRDQTTEGQSREPVSSIGSTSSSIVHTFESLTTGDSTARTVTSQDVTSHTATTTETVMEDRDLSAKPSESTIIKVSETLFSSAHTGHVDEKLSESTVTMTLEKTTVKYVLSPSSFSSSLPSTESEASGDETSNMFSKEFTATSSSLHTPTKSDHELTKTSSDMTETISVSSSTDAEATRDQTTETHSRGTVSSLDSTVTSAVHTFSSLSTGDSTGETVTSKDVTSHAATTTATLIEEKGLSAKPSESTIINVSETLLSSAQTGHLDEKLSESAVTVIPEKTTAKDVLSSSFSSSLESTDSEASGDETSDMFSKEFTTTSSSLYTSTKSDHELTKTSSDMTETMSVSSSTDAEATRRQTTETHSREPVSFIASTVTSALHPFSSLSTGESKRETDRSEDVTSPVATTTATIMEGKDLSAKPSGSTIINVLETLFSSAHTGHLDKTLSEITVAMVSEKTTAKDVLSPSSFSSSLTSMESEASGDDTSNMFSKEFTATSSSPYIPTKSDHELTKTLSDMTEKFSVSSSTDAEASRDQTNETHSRATVSSLDSTVTSAVHPFPSPGTADSTAETVTSEDVTSHAATTTAALMEEKGLSAKPSKSTIINVSETLLFSAQTGHLGDKLSESAVTMTPEKTTAKDVLSPSSFSSGLPSTESEASGDDTSNMFSKEFTTTSSSLYTPDHELTKTSSDMTETISLSSSTYTEASRDQTTETHSRGTVSSLDSTVTSAVHPFSSLSTGDSTGEKVTSKDVTSHAATTTATLIEEKGLSAKPSESTIINVSETLLSSAQTGHLDEKLSESAVTVIPEKTTAKDVLSSSFSSSLESTDSEASGDETSDMFSKEFTTTSSSLYTSTKSDHELTKTSSDMTETMSVSSSTDAEATRRQTTETHSREPVSFIASTVTSALHPFSSLSTGESKGETDRSEDVTSPVATTTATIMEGKDLSAKPSGSTIINVLETLFSSAHTGHLDKTLSEITVAMVSEKTTAKDVLSPSSFSSSLTSMESEASGDDTSNMFSKEFTATSSSPYIPTKSDHELTKTLSDMTEKFSVSSSTDAEASRDQTNETHSRATVSSLDSTVTSAVHPFPSPGTADSTAETVTSEDVTSHAATTTAALMEEKGLSAKPSKSTIINVSETLLFSAQTGHLGDKLSESAVTMTPEKTTVKDVLSPSSFSSGLPSTESEASGDDTSNMFSKEFTTTSSSLYTPDHELTKTSSDMTETISLSSSTYTEASRDQTTETHSRGTVSSLDSTVTSAVHPFSSLSTGDSTGEKVTSKDVTSHAATTTATLIEEKGLSAKPSESTIINVSETLLSSAQTGHLDEKLSESAVTVIPEKTTAKDVLSSSFSSSLESTDSEASGDETSDMFSKEFTTTSSSLYTSTKSDHELTKTSSDMTETMSVSSSTDAEATRRQTTETHSREPVSFIASTVTSALHPFSSLSTGESKGETDRSEDVTSPVATTTATIMEGKDLSAKPSGSTIINVLETLFSSAHTGHLDKTLSEITVAMVSEKTTAKDVLSPSSFSSSLTSMESEASGDDTSNMFSKEFTATSSSPYIPTKSDHELTKTLSDMTEKFSVSSSTDAEASRDQTNETPSRATVSSLDSTVTSAVHPFPSPGTADSTAETVTSEDVTSHAATTTAALMEEKGLSAKPSKSTIINVSETLLFSAQTGHLGDKLSESAVTMTPEKTTVKDVLSPSSFSSGLPSTESEASGDDTSNMFSKEFTTTSSSLYTPDHELTKTSSDMTETISLSSSTYAEASRDQTTETHSRGTVSSLDSTVTSAVHPFSSLSTGDSTGEKVTSKDVTSHSATTTSTMMEDKDLSPKPSESTIINVSDTLFSSAHTRHLDKTLSEITVAMVSEKTTAKDVLSPSSFSSSLTSMESEASGDDTSNMFSKEFTATSSSLYTSNKSDHELTKTSSDTTETISVSSSTHAEATRGLSPDLLSREPVSSLESTVTSAVHTFSSLSTGDSKGETDTSEDVTSPVATTTATIMEGKDLSAKPSGSTIINVLETLFSSAHTGHLDKTLSEITVAMVSEKTTAKDVLSPSSFSSSLTSMESEASGDDTSNMFSKVFTATSSSPYIPTKSDHELTKTLSDMTEKFSVSSSTDAEASRDQTNETHSRATVSSLDSTVTSAVHPFPSPGTADSTAETVTSEDVTSHAATITAALMEEKGLSAKPSKSSIINVSETLLFSAQTGHLGDKLSKSAVTMIPEKTTVKDVLSPSSFSSGLPSTESEASGDDTSNMFSKEFTTTSSSLYTPDHELTKTSSDMTETISLSSSTYAEASRDQTTETHSRGNVSSLDSTVTSAVHTFSSLSTGDSTGETVTSKDVTSHAATTTATPIEEKGLSANHLNPQSLMFQRLCFPLLRLDI